jgi:hypothetical protein
MQDAVSADLEIESRALVDRKQALVAELAQVSQQLQVLQGVIDAKRHATPGCGGSEDGSDSGGSGDAR